MTRAHSCGGQVAPDLQPLNDALECHLAEGGAKYQHKAMQQGQCLLLSMQACQRLRLSDAALAGAQLWPPHSLNAGA